MLAVTTATPREVPPERYRRMMPVPVHVLQHLDSYSWPDPGTRTGRAARWRVLDRVLTEYDRLLTITSHERNTTEPNAE